MRRAWARRTSSRGVHSTSDIPCNRLLKPTPALAKLRKWRIKGFDNHMVFYEPRPDGISVVRVLHAASNWWALLGLEG